MKIPKITELVRTSERVTSPLEHEKYPGIDRAHRELHFLPSLASQLAKLATGELGEIGKISKKSAQIPYFHDFSGFS